MTRLRSLASVMVLALAGALMTACSPAPGDKLAIRRTADGGIELVFALCRNDRATHYFIREQESDDGLLKWGAYGPEASSIDPTPLFQAPAGWTVDEETLTELEPGVPYDAYFYVNSLSSDLRSITIEAIEALGPGDVLGPGQGSRATVMSDYDFHEAAARKCSA